MDSEAGIFSLTFDRSGTRLITTEADKTIKMYKEDDMAVSTNCDQISKKTYNRNSKFNALIILLLFQTEETHPINWRPEIIKRRKY